MSILPLIASRNFIILNRAIIKSIEIKYKGLPMKRYIKINERKYIDE